MSKMFLLQAIGQIDDKLIEEARTLSPRKAHRSSWGKWTAIAACLLVAVVLILPKEAKFRGGLLDAKGEATADSMAPSQSGGSDSSAAGDSLPGEIHPTLWYQGRAFTWAHMASEGDLWEDGWNTLGTLKGPTTDENMQEDLWLYTDIEAEGTVYGNEKYPDVLYVQMTTDWFENKWVRFAIPELGQPIVCWDGRLYCAAAHSYPDVKGLRELPEGCIEVGRTHKSDSDIVPTAAGGCNMWYLGCPIWMDPTHPEIIYLQETVTHRDGSYTIYAPAQWMTTEQVGQLTIPDGLLLQ